MKNFPKNFKNLIFIPLILLINITSSTSDSYLEVIDKPCERKCDSHFTGEECWKKTYDYYINHLFQSVTQFKNAIHYSDKVDSSDVFNKTYYNYKANEEGIKKLIDDFFKSPDFKLDSFLLETVDMLKKQEFLQVRTPKAVPQCPTKCNFESLKIWIGLFGVFVGLTIGSVIFVVAFVLFSKLQLQKFDKRKNSATDKNEIYHTK